MDAYYLTVGIISSIVWILVPFFRRRSNYIYYFILIAFSAAYGVVYLALPISIPTRTIMSVTALSIPALFKGFFRKHAVPLVIIGILLYVISHYIPIDIIQSVSTGISAMLTGLLIILLFSGLTKENSLNAVLLLITLYELLTTFKLSFLLINPYGLLNYYYIVSIVQIFIGVGLIIIKDGNLALNKQ